MLKARQNGFTLIELSIVLVIIGLLVGGVLAGRTLIRSSELLSVQTDVNKFKTAISAFMDKYDALPGDMPNATTYWGTASGGCPNGTGTGTQTCNGTGNGIIFPPGVFSEAYEMQRVWQHLGNSGLIAGSYTGVPGPGGIWDNTPGVNVPPLRLSGAWIAMYYLGNFTDSNTYQDDYEHVFVLLAAFTPTEAYTLDSKYDDGLPGSGSIMGWKQSSAVPNCTTSDIPTIARYNIANPNKLCTALYLKSGF